MGTAIQSIIDSPKYAEALDRWGFQSLGIETTAEGIEKYLGSGMIRGIGPTYAKKLVQAFGTAVFDLIEAEPARKLVGAIKESKLKVQASIQDAQVRVTGKNKDDLQAVIAYLKANPQGVPLQFNNFR